MTPMKEDYLKIIFELGGTKKKVSNKQIALSLDIAAGSVTEMVGKLVQEGLAKHTPYAGISLTKKGIRYAETLVRKHRIWEDFLVDKLDYDLPDVHTEAEVLEHVTSERLVDSLEAFLGHPTHCPHGGAIPDKDGHYQEDSHTSLADTPDGTTVTIERFIDNHDLLVYLHDTLLKIGQQVTVLKHDPFEGPVTVVIQATGEEIPISFKAAHNVFVK
ncbi:metal-dependent transcriptional regulator [Lactiplantibacillus sp. DA1]|uniref:metal-dependent transcriptional regulator n=1 Tax=Lactiplantibacillus sp. DA1 TaxID=3079857 RepID=UPI00292A6743|nr:metal-dependent transcriptional regulator [Lactiplantibacillus sp. DA1]MDV0429437.1 metal-dependent transcriptional regulator [Lactiplantibacillus sp. DA1]